MRSIRRLRHKVRKKPAGVDAAARTGVVVQAAVERDEDKPSQPSPKYALRIRASAREPLIARTEPGASDYPRLSAAIFYAGQVAELTAHNRALRDVPIVMTTAPPWKEVLTTLFP